MSEIDAKREARRRRILENSERRLLKITGRYEDTETEITNTEAGSSQSLHSATDKDENHLGHGVNNIIADNYDWQNRRSADGELCNADNNWNDIAPKLNSYRYEERNCIGESARTALRKRLHPDSSDAYEETRGDRSNENSVVDSQIVNSHKTSLPSILLSNRMNYILLATVVNILLIMRLDHLFGKTIAVPYITMMLGRMLICDNSKETQDGSLLVAALILCNIRPELTYRLKRLMALLATMLGDLALYIFSFTLMYTGISYCFPDAEARMISNSLTSGL